MPDRGHSTWFPGARPPAGIDPTAPHSPIVGADPEQAPYADPHGGPKHCWVSPSPGRWVPGLLVEWRKPKGQLWEGRVIYPQVIDGRWVTAEEWVLPSRLRESDPSAQT